MGPWSLRVVRLTPDDGGLPASGDEHGAGSGLLLSELFPAYFRRAGELERFAELELERARRLRPLPPGGAA